MTHLSVHRVVLIEPHRDLAELLVQVLNEEGYQALATRDVGEAIRALEAQDASVVLADLCDYSGQALALATSQLTAAAGPARLGLTTADRPSSDAVKALGFAFLLLKPFTVEEFLAKIGAQCVGAANPAREQTINQYFEALSRRDWDALVALCADDVEYHLPGSDPTFSRRVQGKAAFRAFSEQTFRAFPEAVFTVEEQVVLPSAVIGRFSCRWKGEGVLPAESVGAVLFHFKGPLISQIGVRMELQRPLAAIPATAR